MQYFLLIAAISITAFTACNNNSNSQAKTNNDGVQPKQEAPAMTETKTTAPVTIF
jgi:hypothetical protein